MILCIVWTLDLTKHYISSVSDARPIYYEVDADTEHRFNLHLWFIVSLKILLDKSDSNKTVCQGCIVAERSVL